MTIDPTSGSADFEQGAQSQAAAEIEFIPLPMLEVEGPEHIVCFANPAFCRLLETTLDQLIGKPFAKIVRDGSRFGPLLDRIYETGEANTHVEPDPSEPERAYWVYAMWPRLGLNARPERVVIQMTRAAPLHRTMAAMNEALLISGLRQHELRAEAEALTAQSQAEIAEKTVVTAALRDINERLRQATGVSNRANKAKDDFLAALSHELRTPLTPVLIAAAALREDPRLPPDMREQLIMIERNISLEARLIDDMLDLTKIAHGKLHLRTQPCDAHSLVSLAVDIVREEALAKHIVIERLFAAHRSGLVADPARFQQVIWNLLRNAVKFTPANGKISIRTNDERGPNGESWLRIEVTDSGIGIDPAGLQEIFLPFEQGGLTGDHRFGGVGLGLAIARAVVVMHGGKIAAESAGLNCGATFVVELPGAIEPVSGITELSAPTSESGTPEKKKAAVLRLLVVEDHVTTLKALANLLERDGHRVTTAANVAEALAAAATNTFDLVISDLGLPDGTGTELMEQLRDRYHLRGIALSGYGMEEDLARSSAAGFVTHLVKPVSIAELRRALAALPALEA
ncbi:MAG: ATP-binding protein [Opitutaceae bacterium]